MFAPYSRMKVPHILLAAGNLQKLRSNIAHLLDATALRVIDAEIAANVKGLYDLGGDHFAVARALAKTEWRHKVSRFYYAAYNTQRAVRLAESGSYSQDLSDHKKISEVPDAFPRSAIYTIQFPLLRDDRNLCDYDHTALEQDLTIAVSDVQILVSDFRSDAQTYLAARGITV